MPDDPAARPPVHVRLAAGERYPVDVSIGAHRLRVDAHPAAAGDPGGTGPAPFETLLAALGACTAMTVRLVADRKGWPVEGVRVEMTHDRRRAEPGEPGTTPSGWIFEVDLAVTVDGALDADQRARLEEVAHRCPIHQALVGPVHVDTRFAWGEPD